MLQRLCALGYGKGEDAGLGDKRLELDLVFNPLGAFLPPEQGALEAEYKAKLKADFDIDFDNLFAITNAPGGRFGERLLKTNNMDRYMNTLIGAFNEETVPAMMCRTQLSVSWDGTPPSPTWQQTRRFPLRAKSASGITAMPVAQDRGRVEAAQRRRSCAAQPQKALGRPAETQAAEGFLV